MSKEFDAYYKWLGIPPKDQPPHHYRLLGIELFEENPEVIEASAERQASYLHEVSAGPNVKESQKLLNEIAAARLCLLDPEKKAAYDARLESKVAANVTFSDLDSDSSPLDDLPWDDLENLMTGDSASETATGQVSSDTQPLPSDGGSGVTKSPKGSGAMKVPNSSGVMKGPSSSGVMRGPSSSGVMRGPNSSGVFNVPRALAPQKQEEPEPEASGIPRRWLAIGGAAALLLVVAIAIRLITGGDDDIPPPADNPARPSTANQRKSPDKNLPGPPRKVPDKPKQVKQTPQVAPLSNGGGGAPKNDSNQDATKQQQVATAADVRNPRTVVPDQVEKDDTVRQERDETAQPENPEQEPIVEGPITTNGFETILPTNVTSSVGTTFEVSEDGLVLASGTPRGDAVTFLATTPIPNITAIRLEALPHSGLPNRGPGRGRKGRFEITEVSIHAASFDGKIQESEYRPSGVVSNESANALDKLLDGNNNSFWPVQRPGKVTTLVMYMQRPLGNDSGTSLRLELEQRFTLGHFRISVSNDPSLLGKQTPSNAVLPLFVNVGGDVAERDGIRWLASEPFEARQFGYVGGEPLVSNTGVAPFSSCISGIEAFRVRVPNGEYNVGLLFSGGWPENVGASAFTVAIENEQPQQIKDIPSVARGDQKVAQYFVQGVEVSDGILDVEFTKAQGETVLNGFLLNKTP